MFKENIEVIKNVFDSYFNNSGFFVLFLVSIFILFAIEEKRKTRNLLIYYPLIVIAIITNPFCAEILLKVIRNNVYYRLIWLVPLGLVIAYSATTLIFKIKSKNQKIISVIFFILIIIFSGKLVYTQEVFEDSNNLYKLPNSYVEVANIISKLPIKEKMVMIDTKNIGYVRQLDASIKLAYSRRPDGKYQVYPIVNYYNQGNIPNLVYFCQRQNVNIIVYDKSIKLSDNLENYGFEKFDETENYDIYVLNNIDI